MGIWSHIYTKIVEQTNAMAEVLRVSDHTITLRL